MANYSKFLEIQSAVARTVDLSQTSNILELGGGGLQMDGSTSGHVVISASATTTTYSIIWPAAQAASSGYVLTNDGTGHLSWAAAASSGVTSVAFADASSTPIYSISGSPVTTSGTLTQTLTTQSANIIFAGPTTGSAAQPTFRSLVAADIPSLSSSYANTALSNLTTTNINQNLIPAPNGVNDYSLNTLGNISDMWYNAYSIAFTAQDGLSNSDDVSAYTFNGINFSTATGGGTFAIVSANNSGSSSASGSVNITTGNVSGGGTSGSINLTAGNAVTPGNINLSVDVATGGVISVTGPLELNGSTSGSLIIKPAATTTSYAVTMPAAQGAASSFLQNNGSGVLSWATAGAGSVTSVAFSDASTTPIYSISGSPVTGSGTLTQTLTTQSANTVFAGPTTGSAAQPTFRSLVSADIPSLSSIYLPLAGGTMSGAINLGGFAPTNSTTPVNPNDLTNKAYVDGLANGASWHTAVLVATTANITLSGEQTIDGVLTSASRVLVKNQTSSQNNGIYVSASGAWSRAADMNAWSQVPAAAVFVQSGSTNADLGFVCTAITGGTLGTTAITWVQFSSAGAYSADGTTLQLISGVFSIKSGGVGTSQLGSVTDGVTLDQSGAGSTLEIKSGGVGTTQIANSAVTLAKMANLAANSIIGNNTGSSATPIALTQAQVTAFLNQFSSSLQGVVPSSGGGTTNFLRADGSWAAPSGTGTVTSVAMTVPTFLSVSGSPVTSSGTLGVSLSGTALPVLNGGTGTTTSTGTGSVVLSAAPAITGAWTLTDAGSIINATTASKVLNFSLSGMTASTTLTLSSAQSTTQTLTIPNITGADTAVTQAFTQTLTNKTIAAGSNTITGLTNTNLSGSAGITGANIATNTIANSNLAQMATDTIKGNNSGSTANAADLTVAQVNAILPVFTSSLNGLAPLSGGGTTNYLRADGTWAAPAGTSYSADGTTLQLVSTTFSIKNAGVSATQLATGAFDQKTIVGGAGTTASVAYSPAVEITAIYGGASTLTANTTYALRWGMPSNSETAGKFYLADWNTSSFDLFWAIGLYNSTSSTTTGTSITIVSKGALTLGSSDATFGSSDQGRPVYLGSSGAFTPYSTFSPSAGDANMKLGIAQTASSIFVDTQMMGVS